MPNVTRTMADTAGFVPQVWANKALDVLRANIVATKLVAKDVDFEPAMKGKSLTIPYPGTFAAADKVADTPLAVQTPTGGAGVTVTLNKHKAVDFLVEDFARVQASGDLLERYVEPAAIAIAEQVEADILALYTGLGAGGGTGGVDLTAATIRGARKILNDNKAPQAGRSLVISTKDEVALMGDSALQSYFAFAKPDTIAEGALANLYGFDIFVSQLVPFATNFKNLALTKNAIIMASRPLDEPTDGVESSTIVDEASGIAIRVMRQYDMANRGHRIGFDVLYGVSVLRATQGLVVLS